MVNKLGFYFYVVPSLLCCFGTTVKFLMRIQLSISITTEVLKLQQLVDSQGAKKEEGKYKVYPFNPNFITDFKAYTLGMSLCNLTSWRFIGTKGKWINSVADFKKVTEGRSLVGFHKPFSNFRIGFHTQNQNPKPFKKEKSFNEKTDLNLATVEDLEEVYGIGPAFSKRILEFRKSWRLLRWGAIVFCIWSEAETVENVLKDFTVKTQRKLQRWTSIRFRLPILPPYGISFSLAKDIWEFVQLREGISKLGELTKLKEWAHKS